VPASTPVPLILQLSYYIYLFDHSIICPILLSYCRPK